MDQGVSFCALGGIRTPDLRYRKPTLYPLSYEGVATVAANGNEKSLAGAGARKKNSQDKDHHMAGIVGPMGNS